MNEVTKQLMCLQMRSGVQKWLEADRCVNLMAALEDPQCPRFVRIDNEMVNTADITGVFEATSMEEATRRKNGQWHCGFGQWHEKLQKCGCKLTQRSAADEKFYEENGYYKA